MISYEFTLSMGTAKGVQGDALEPPGIFKKKKKSIHDKL